MEASQKRINKTFCLIPWILDFVGSLIMIFYALQHNKFGVAVLFLAIVVFACVILRFKFDKDLERYWSFDIIEVCIIMIVSGVIIATIPVYMELVALIVFSLSVAVSMYNLIKNPSC